MLAAQNGHVNIVRTLLEHKADPQLKSEAGDTALHYATRNPDAHTRSEIFSFIQDAGGDASLPNAQGLSASDLLRRGAEVNSAILPPPLLSPHDPRRRPEGQVQRRRPRGSRRPAT